MTAIGPVVLQIEVNGQIIRDYPIEHHLYQEWEHHDRFLLTFVIPKGHGNVTGLVAWKKNAPVKLTWGRAPTNLSIWYGYVNHHKINSNSPYESNTTQITYTVLGTSKVMNADQWKRWENTTPSGIAQTIAKKYSFRAVTTFVDWPIKYEVQDGLSDFKFLVKIAQKYGFRFWVSGGTLYFIDPSAVLHGPSGRYVPQYYIDHFPGRLDTAKDFHILQGDAIPGGTEAVRKIAGVDASTNKPFQVSADGDTSRKNVIHQTGRHVTSRAQAKRLINAQQRMAQFWQAGSAELFGLVTLYPNKLILLDGKGLPNQLGGNWLINAVHHKLSINGTYNSALDTFTSHVKLVKNTTDVIPKVSEYKTITPEIVQCVLSGGVWQSINTSALTSGVVQAG